MKPAVNSAGGRDLDELDLKILEYLQADSRRPFLEIARYLKVSGGTVHARVNRLKELGVIQGSKVVIDYQKVGFHVMAFVGIKLSKAKEVKQIQEQLASIEEIVEIHYTTGAYSLLTKIVVPSMQDLYRLLADKLQRIEDVQSTETFIVLNSPLIRDPSLGFG